jgi:flagellar motility protein MotE (MotC chaperone)
MAPDSAANILQQLDDIGVVKILIHMKDEEIARILEAMTKLGGDQMKRVAEITDKLRLSIRDPQPKTTT